MSDALDYTVEGALPVSTGAATEFLCFMVAGEIYALPLAVVSEVLRPPPLTRVPRAAAHVLGVVAVRGKVITVVETRALFGLVKREDAEPHRIILIGGEHEQIGLAVDRVLRVMRFGAGDVEPLSSISGDLGNYIAGIARPAGAAEADDEIVMLLGVRQLLGAIL